MTSVSLEAWPSSSEICTGIFQPHARSDLAGIFKSSPLSRNSPSTTLWSVSRGLSLCICLKFLDLSDILAVIVVVTSAKENFHRQFFHPPPHSMPAPAGTKRVKVCACSTFPGSSPSFTSLPLHTLRIPVTCINPT